MKFEDIKKVHAAHVTAMFAKFQTLHVVDCDKAAMWDLYLDSFPPGTNELFKARREHDCVHCRQYLKALGCVVGIEQDGSLVSVWDVAHDDPVYGPVFTALARYVKLQPVGNVFMTSERNLGVSHNMAQAEDGKAVKWEHFHAPVPAAFIKPKVELDTLRGLARTAKEVFKRSLDTISIDAVETVLELVAQNSLYKGEEWKSALEKFLELQREYATTKEALRDNFCWTRSAAVGPVVSKLRNHSIGVLLVDISESVDLDGAVRKYEAIVAPSNYMRPKEIFTKKMLEDAKKTVDDLGYGESLARRFATIDDITVNNVLWADRSAASRMTGADVFAELADDVAVDPKKFGKVAEIPIDKFVSDVLPTATGVELLMESAHRGNLVSLIAPAHAGSKPMFKWGNNFGWAYVGNMADGMKERVKMAGGKIDGVLRFSIQWNEKGDNRNDYDAHCVEPSHEEVYFRSKQSISGGNLDVDIINPGSKIAVENIAYTHAERMPKGVYTLFVQLFSNAYGDTRSGFRAQVEANGQLHEFDIAGPHRVKEIVQIAEVDHDGHGDFTIRPMVGGRQGRGSAIGGLACNAFHPVTLMLLSPNYWDAQTCGNKHFMFMLKDAKNGECPNGFFNEFLKPELVAHKRVFAALGSKMQVPPADNQLTGLGFSSTKPASVLLKVHGSTIRVVRVTI